MNYLSFFCFLVLAAEAVAQNSSGQLQLVQVVCNLGKFFRKILCWNLFFFL